MSVHQLFRKTAFSPEEIAVLVVAYESTLKKLRLVDRNDPLTQMIAKKVIELAERGIRDPEQLIATTMSEMGL
jgi:hypothetical protein